MEYKECKALSKRCEYSLRLMHSSSTKSRNGYVNPQLAYSKAKQPTYGQLMKFNTAFSEEEGLEQIISP